MTTIYPPLINSIICNTENEVFELGSTNSVGSPDLDLRPAGMARDTLVFEVQSCINCGFCAPLISKEYRMFFSKNKQENKNQLKNIREIIQSKDYQELLNNKYFPYYSNSFLATSLIQEKIGNYYLAFRIALNSA